MRFQNQYFHAPEINNLSGQRKSLIILHSDIIECMALLDTRGIDLCSHLTHNILVSGCKCAVLEVS